MTTTAILLGVISGLALAAMFILIAISFTLVLAASGVFNFAQGSIVMIGTLLAFSLGVALKWPVLITVAGIFAAGMLSGLVAYVTAVWPALGRSHSFTHTTLMTTIGLGLALNAVAEMLFGGDSQRVVSYVTESPVVIFSVPVRPVYIVMIAVGVVVTATIEWVVRRTSVGRVFRLTLEDPEGATLLGIDTRKTIVLTFVAAGAMSALAGYLIAPVTSASPFAAHELTFYGFAAMAIGGFGSFLGALTGGLVVGMLAGVLPILVEPHLILPILWMSVVVTLIVRPSGLWGIVGLFGAARVREV
jgi:branched-subunit amino acid ABC-type transport system permease component